MTNTINLRQQIKEEMENKRLYEKSSDEIKRDCIEAFNNLEKIKINHKIAEKQLDYLRGK